MAPMRRNGPRRVTPKDCLHQQSESPATTLPFFTAVMLERHILQHTLRIPMKSAMIYGEDLSEAATLTVPNGNKTWKIRVKRGKNFIWFDGLKEFIEHYSIHYGSVLVFIYQGSSEFSVRICDAMGAEIDYPSHAPKNTDEETGFGHHNKEDKESDDDDHSIEILIPNKLPKSQGSCKSKPFYVGFDDEGKKKFTPRKRGRPRKQGIRSVGFMDYPASSKRAQPKEGEFKYGAEEEAHEMVVSHSLSFTKSKRLMLSKETKMAVHAAEMQKLQNPSFMVILRPYAIKCGLVFVPVEFVRRYLMNQISEDVLIQVHNENRKWPAKCSFRDNDGSTLIKKLHQGWASFSSSKKLKAGDVCVFEVIINRLKEMLIRVWIYRAANYAGPSSSPKCFKAN
ncbi:B3 domain-containing transcription factor VRN1-like [Humulus lupulus]|uniref:B3 domain-containing transcription factor VRN1-like n=1 Tax=Humulus lupulus TaxID=3486 RepID=UPI002B417E79|nr:B3 domain-containing transcription factor VRN1-like [Humulus lupulus]